MTKNPLLRLQELGQSVWLDLLSRNLLESGELQKLIDEDGVSGVTSNPAIFEKAIGGGSEYDESIRALAGQGKSAAEIYRAVTVADVQHAADLLRPIYDRTEGRDGFVSLEVSPHLAYDTAGTIDEARQLWRAIGRPNAMVKVPGTKEGLPAIRQLTREGVNVNVTLLFALPRYREAAEAYVAGLTERAAAGEPVDRVASVASFFVSRIDTLLDPALEATGAARNMETPVDNVVGQVAIACGRIAYQMWKEIFTGREFRDLEARGGRRQRLLWGSTSVKNPAYSDVKYVEALIGPQTVNTMPLETLEAYRDHGDPAERLEQGLTEARQTLEALALSRIELDEATRQLEREGVEKFVVPFDRTIAEIQDKSQAVRRGAGG